MSAEPEALRLLVSDIKALEVMWQRVWNTLEKQHLDSGVPAWSFDEAVFPWDRQILDEVYRLIDEGGIPPEHPDERELHRLLQNAENTLQAANEHIDYLNRTYAKCLELLRGFLDLDQAATVQGYADAYAALRQRVSDFMRLQ